MTRTRRLRSRNQGVVRLLFNPPIEISENMIRKGEEKEGIGEGTAREALNRERRVRLFCGEAYFAKLRRRDNPVAQMRPSEDTRRGAHVSDGNRTHTRCCLGLPTLPVCPKPTFSRRCVACALRVSGVPLHTRA